MRNIEIVACKECTLHLSKLALSLLKDKKNCPSCGNETEWVAPETALAQRERIGRETAREIEDLKLLLNDQGMLGLGVLNILLDARIELENAKRQIKALNFQLKLGIASVIDDQTKTTKAN